MRAQVRRLWTGPAKLQARLAFAASPKPACAFSLLPPLPSSFDWPRQTAAGPSPPTRGGRACALSGHRMARCSHAAGFRRAARSGHQNARRPMDGAGGRGRGPAREGPALSHGCGIQPGQCLDRDNGRRLCEDDGPRGEKLPRFCHRRAHTRVLVCALTTLTVCFPLDSLAQAESDPPCTTPHDGIGINAEPSVTDAAAPLQPPGEQSVDGKVMSRAHAAIAGDAAQTLRANVEESSQVQPTHRQHTRRLDPPPPPVPTTALDTSLHPTGPAIRQGDSVCRPCCVRSSGQ